MYIDIELSKNGIITRDTMQIIGTNHWSHIKDLARNICKSSHSDKVRVGIGSNWSNWIN